jgi:scaffold Nfu/NifU family protein
MGFEVREIQSTPNPNAMKFVLKSKISEEPVSFYSREQATANPLASKLLAIAGVSNVMLLNDFVTIGKQPQARWSDINGRVKLILASG